MLSDFYKLDDDDKIWWCDDTENRGARLFSFDKKKIYNFFKDYDELSEEQKKMFAKECPELARLKEQK